MPIAGDPAKRAELSIQTSEECAARLVEVLDQGPVAFPSERHAEMMRTRGDAPRGDLVLATGRAATAPPSVSRGSS
jgi:hypothetical protein